MWNIVNKLDELLLVPLTPLFLLYYRAKHIRAYLKCKQCGKWLLVPIYLRLGLCHHCNRSIALQNEIRYYTGDGPGTQEFGKSRDEDTAIYPLSDHEKLYDRLAGRLGTGSILDVGCGYGPVLSRAKSPPDLLYGIEVTAGAIKTAKNLVRIGNFCLGEGEHIPFQSNSFDCVVCSEVLEHLTREADRAVVGELFRVLKPGGTAIITVPNGKGVSGQLPYHIQFFSFQSFQDLVKEAGFEIVAGQKFGLWIPIVSKYLQFLPLATGNRLHVDSYISVNVPELLSSNFLIEGRKLAV